jgi:hypothetical protein
MITETHYEWELQDASGEWVAGGSANDLANVKREGQHCLAVYSQDGPYSLLIHKHQTELIEDCRWRCPRRQLIEEVSLG